MNARGRLAVVVDGVAMSEDDARAFWDRFSRYMEEHPRDLAGFARAEGLASVHPEMGPGGAMLVGSASAPQRAYANARAVDAGDARGERASSGSPDPQRPRAAGPRGPTQSSKRRKK